MTAHPRLLSPDPAARPHSPQPHRLRRAYRQHVRCRTARPPLRRLPPRTRPRRRRDDRRRTDAGPPHRRADARQLPARHRRRHPAFPQSDRAGQGSGRRHPPATLPHRRARRFRPLLRAALVALRRPQLSRHRRQPPDDRSRDRGADRRPYRRRRPLPKIRLSGGGGLGRLPFPSRPVLDAVVQHPRRPVGRLPGKPHPLLTPHHRRHPPRLRRGFHHRPGRQPRRMPTASRSRTKPSPKSQPSTMPPARSTMSPSAPAAISTSKASSRPSRWAKS